MAMTDPVGDLLTRIRNGQMRATSDSVTVPASQAAVNVLEVLQREGYIRGCSRQAPALAARSSASSSSTTTASRSSRSIKRVSNPGRRVYSRSGSCRATSTASASSILSTPRGVMSDAEARAANVGGEVLCKVF